MTQDEYKNQSGRFRVLFADDAREAEVPGIDCWNDRYYCGSVLVEFSPDGKPLRCLGSDMGEPEDKSLTRDFIWVVRELNALAEAKP